MMIVGIDPGTGSSSPAAIFMYNVNSYRIELALTFGSKMPKAVDRIRYISQQIGERIEYYKPELVCIENFMMRGKGGETLQRFIGSIIPYTDSTIPFIEVQNTTVKKMVGGTGKAEKLQVAMGVKNYFKGSKLIDDLIKDENWDVLDAAAIAIAGYKLWKDGLK